MTQQNAATSPKKTTWSVEHYANFWADPDPALIPETIAPDVVGYWPSREPVRGVDDYTDALTNLLTQIPDLRLEVAEHAQNGEFVFIRWIARGTGANGQFEITGIDRICLRDGLVAENIIRFDSAEFMAAVSGEPPLA